MNNQIKGQPLAEDVGRAILAACKETNEDPFGIVGGRYSARARHYALHALLHVFPDLGRHSACRLVGVKKSSAVPSFWMASWDIVRAPPGKTWWDAAVYARVIQGTRAADREKVSRPIAVRKQKKTRSFRLVDAPTTYRGRHRPLIAETNVTAELMGDPAPGRSALDARLFSFTGAPELLPVAR
jgi:hypothetical protein